MIVTAAHDGHGSYGLRVVGDVVGLYFRPEWRWITLYLPDEALPACIRLSESFWASNHELRSQRLKSFFDRHGMLDWGKNQPPHFELEPIGGGVFHLKWLDRPRASSTD